MLPILMQQGSGPLGGLGGLLPILVIFGIFWLLVLRPQNKEFKRKQTLQQSLKVGDEVVTSGGIVGTIASVDDHFVMLEIAKGTKMRVVRTQVEYTTEEIRRAAGAEEKK